jgi:hypothetical protein
MPIIAWLLDYHDYPICHRLIAWLLVTSCLSQDNLPSLKRLSFICRTVSRKAQSQNQSRFLDRSNWIRRLVEVFVCYRYVVLVSKKWHDGKWSAQKKCTVLLCKNTSIYGSYGSMVLAEHAMLASSCELVLSSYCLFSPKSTDYWSISFMVILLQTKNCLYRPFLIQTQTSG